MVRRRRRRPLRDPGTAARDRPRAAAGRARPDGSAGHGAAAVGGRAADHARPASSGSSPCAANTAHRWSWPRPIWPIRRATAGSCAQDGALLRIVEDRDATPAERAITEINSGIYAFALASLFEALHGLGTSNAQGEYYLPELVDVYRKAGRVVLAERLGDPDEIRGINTRAELAEVGRLLPGPNQRRPDGGRRHAGRSGHRLHRPRRRRSDRIRSFTRSSFSRAEPPSAPQCELHAGTRIMRIHPRRPRHGVQPHGDRRVDDRRRRACWAVCQNSSTYNTWSDDRTSVTSSRSRNPQSVTGLKLVICPILAMPRSARA